jgi:hypothetical protein
MANCPKCIIDDRGALPAAAAALQIQSMANAEADADAWETLAEEQRDHLRALAELDCHRAAKIRQWTEESRLERTKIYGGEYKGGYEVVGVDRVAKKKR